LFLEEVEALIAKNEECARRYNRGLMLLELSESCAER
jgi:hypothetical protein